MTAEPPPIPPASPSPGSPGWSPHWSTRSPWTTLHPLAPIPTPLVLPPADARPLTRLQLNSSPMIALAFAASALVASLPLATLMCLGAYARPDLRHLLAIVLAAIFLLGLGLHAVALGPILWRLGGRKLIRHGRRWFVLAGSAAGLIEGFGISLPQIIRHPQLSPEIFTAIVIIGSAAGLFGALGGLVFSLLATRRAPLEAVFE